MKRQLLDLACSLTTAKNVDDFWALAHAALEERGVGSILYGAFGTSKEAAMGRFSKSMLWKSSHSREFFEAFGGDAALDLDPSVEHCVASRDVMFWHHDADWRSVPDALRKRVSIERDLGLHVGFSVPTSFFSPFHIGGIGVAMPDVPIEEFERLWADKGQEILTICGVLDSGMRGQFLREVIHLSSREKECLAWLAAGLRPDQIADRLAISSKSIEKYIAGARRKLKANTRDHAVAKALIFNLITP